MLATPLMNRAVGRCDGEEAGRSYFGCRPGRHLVRTPWPVNPGSGAARMRLKTGRLAVERRAMRTKTDASYALVQALLKRADALAQVWRKLIGASYRPEKHYMRGPGPKWRAKYAHAGGGGAKRASEAAQVE